MFRHGYIKIKKYGYEHSSPIVRNTAHHLLPLSVLIHVLHQNSLTSMLVLHFFPMKMNLRQTCNLKLSCLTRTEIIFSFHSRLARHDRTHLWLSLSQYSGGHFISLKIFIFNSSASRSHTPPLSLPVVRPETLPFIQNNNWKLISLLTSSRLPQRGTLSLLN